MKEPYIQLKIGNEIQLQIQENENNGKRKRGKM